MDASLNRNLYASKTFASRSLDTLLEMPQAARSRDGVLYRGAFGSSTGSSAIPQSIFAGNWSL